MISPRNRSIITAVVAAGSLIVCLFIFFFFIYQPSSPKFIPAPPQRILALTITDGRTSRPLPGAQVSFHIDQARPQNLTADDKGVVAIPLPEKDPNYLSITAKFPHHVPTGLTLRNDPENPKQPIPASYTLPLDPGTTLGGIIQDPDGKPIAGVTVFLLVPSNNSSNIRPALSDFAVKTDADGRWTTDLMPAELPDIWIRLKHPDYASDSMYGQTPKPPMEKLRDQTGVMILRHGITVAGRVTDPAGKSIAGASVVQGHDRWGSNYPSAKTDADGRYSFKNIPAGDLVLTVQAKNFSPELKTFIVTTATPDIDFQLSPGHVLKGHVVDAAGKPVPHASINADTWRGNRSIEWQTTTDIAGAFTWTSAPADEVLYNAYAKGYAYNRSATLTASPDVDNKVVLTQPLAVHVAVTDADTHHPITRYHLISGISWGAGQPLYWERSNGGAANHPDGKHDFTITENRAGHAVRIEADGYAPADSRVFTDNEANVTLAFQLHKAPNLTVTVLTSDGKPVAGVIAALATLSSNLQIQNGRISQQDDHLTTRTDTNGKFSFPPQSPPYKLVLTHDSGFIILSSDQISPDKPITLEPWAHLQGTLKVGPNPAAGEVVYGWYSGADAGYRPGQPNIFLSIQSTTDAAGHFNIDRVPPGQFHLGRQIRLGNQMTTYTQNVPFTFKPGDSLTANIGGTGRPVIGHVIIPPDLTASGNWVVSRAELSNDTRSQKINFPANFQTMSPEEKKTWLEKWRSSPDGKAFVAAQQKSIANRIYFPFLVNTDGSFRIDDVPAGVYKLLVMLSAPPDGRNRMWGKELATATVDVTVPDMPTGRSDDPLDLSAIPLKPASTPSTVPAN